MLLITSFIKRMQQILLLLLLMGGLSFCSLAQQQIQWVPNPNQDVMVCDTSIIPFQLVKSNGSAFTLGQQIDLNLQLPSWLDIITVNGDQLQINQQTPHTINASISKAAAGDTLSVFLKVVASCEAFSLSPNQTAIVNGTANLVQSGSILSTTNLNGRSLTLKRGILALASVQNKNAVSSLYGNVERCYTYTNTSTSDSLSIDLNFIDSIRYQNNNGNHWVRLFDVSLQNSPFASVTGSSISDEMVSLQVRINKLPPLASIVICDSIQLITCPKAGTDSTLTEFSLAYGCIDDTLCQMLTNPINNLSSVAIDNSRPVMSRSAISINRTCPADSNQYIWKVWNSGSAVATSATFSWFYLYSQNTLSNIDTNSIRIYRKGTSGQQIPLSWSKELAANRVSYGPGKDGRNIYNLTVNETIQPGDTFYLAYREFESCPSGEADTRVLLGKANLQMFDHTLMGRMNHPCRPSRSIFKLFHTNNSFSLSQYNENLIGTMEDQQEEWFEIKSNGGLVVFNRYFNTSPIYNRNAHYDPDRFRISIDVALDSGLCIADARKLFLVSTNGDTLFPITVDHRAGSTVGASNQPQYCTKDTLTANFKLPANFYSSTGGAAVRPTVDYFSFFNQFSVWFKLKADCGFVNFSSGTRASFEQTLYAIFDTLCQPQCRIPLHRVSDDIQINCPGCYVPGWNLEAFDIERLNIGGADTNNNHFPDFIPNPQAQANDVIRSRMILGDTIAFNIEAFVSDGDPIDGYTTAQLGNIFKEGIFYIDTTSLLKKIELIGISGTFTQSGQPSHTFNIDASHPNWLQLFYHDIVNGRLSLRLDSTAWVDSYGYTAFNGFKAYDDIDLQLRFAVTGNLDNSIILGLINRYEMGGFIYMSGTPFNLVNPLQKQDILEIDQNDLRNTSLYPLSVLKDKLYWCTGWDARTMGYGVSAAHTFQRRPIYYANICKDKALRYSFTGSVGRSYVQFGRGEVPAAMDVFPNELRNLWMLDSVRLQLPTNYIVSRINLALRTLVQGNNGRTAVANTSIQFPAANITNRNGYSHFDFAGLPNKWLTEPVRLPNGNIDGSVYQSFFDESKSYDLQIFLEPQDCRDTTKGTERLEMTAYMENNPLHNGSVTRSTNFPVALTKPRFFGSATNFVFDGTSDIEFDFNLNFGGVGLNSVPNVFLYAKSTNGNIDITSSGLRIDASQDFVVLKQYNGGSTYSSLLRGDRTHTYRIVADYDCAAVDSVDTIWLYFGYSCSGRVTAFGPDICVMDSISFNVVKQPAGIQANHSFPSTLQLCDTNWHSIDINATGNQRVEEMKLRFDLPQGISIASLGNNALPSFRLSYDGIVQTVEGSLTNNSYEFDLTGLLPGFIGTAGKIVTVDIPYLVDCSYSINQPFDIQITAADYCGKALQDVNDLFLPGNVNGNYDFSQLQLNSLQVDTDGNCTDSVSFTTTVQNNSTDLTDGFIINYYCLADTLGALNPTCLIGSSSPIQLGANSTQAVSTTLPSNCGACISVIAVVEPISSDCYCGTLNDTLTAQFNCFPPTCSCVPPSFAPCQDDIVLHTGGNCGNSCGALLNYQTTVNGSDTITLNYTFSGSLTGSGSGNGSNTVFPLGTTYVTLVATNDCGTDSCSFTVNVLDTIAPTAICRDISVQLNTSGIAVITAADIDNGSYDSCGVASITLNQTTFDCSDIGLNQVILTVTDLSGNVSSCTANVTVEDTIPPTAICQNITVQLDASGMAVITAADIDNGSYDNCGTVTLGLDSTTFSCADIGLHQVTLTVTDLSGNTSSCTANVTVKDTVPPIAICRNITVQLNASGMAVITAADIDNGSYDNCGSVSLSMDSTTFSCADVGIHQVTLTVTDLSGNISTCTANVTVEDTTPPTAICQNITVQLDASGVAVITAADIDNGSYDNCGTITLSLDSTTFSCADVGVNQVSLTVTDPSGNVSTCIASVTVEDTVPPTAVCQSIAVQLNASGTATITAADIDNGSYDDCGIVSLTIDSTLFTCADVGVNQVSLTVTDLSGNVSTCVANVLVEDTVSPTVICNDITVDLDSNGVAMITSASIDGGSYDACGIQSVTASKCSFDCDDVGYNTVTLTVTDVNGNTSTCDAIVYVNDPSFQITMTGCSDDIIIDCEDANEPVFFDPPSASMRSTLCEIGCVDRPIDHDLTALVNQIPGYTYLGALNGHKYYHSNFTTGWRSAIATPLAYGGHLVTINNAMENNFLTQALPNRSTSWIGYTDAASEGNFVWTNGENATYTNWSAGEPNNTGLGGFFWFGGSDYSVIQGNTGNWLDAGIFGRFRYIMELPCRNPKVPVYQIAGLPSGSVFPTGTTTVTFVALDSASGRTDTCSFDVVVKADSVAPVAKCKNITLVLSSGTLSLSAADVNNGSYDDCSGIRTLSVHPNQFSSANVGQNAVVLTVTDSAGNVDSCKAFVTVIRSKEYCDVSGDTKHEWIDRVTINSYSNLSGNNNGYGNFTALPVNVSIGGVNLKLSPGYAGATAHREYWRVWIDYNKDGDFTDAGEMVFQRARRNTVTGSFNIPASVSAGFYTMRVGMSYGAYPAPCGANRNGEYEDYTLQLSKAAIGKQLQTAKDDAVGETRTVTLFPNPTRGIVHLAFEGEFNESVELTVRSLDGRVILQKNYAANVETQSISLNLEREAKGLYLLQIRSGDYIKVIKFNKL